MTIVENFRLVALLEIKTQALINAVDAVEVLMEITDYYKFNDIQSVEQALTTLEDRIIDKIAENMILLEEHKNMIL